MADKKAKEPLLKESEVLLEECKKVLVEHDNNESLIGIKNPYWDNMNKYRQLVREGK